jgi:hypothetical protein
LILGGLFAAYDYFLAPPWQRVLFEKGQPPAPATAQPLPAHAIEDDGPPAIAEAKPVEKKPADDWQPTIPKLPTGEFTPPAIPSAEAVTKNWTEIPARAFPRPVVLKKDTEVKMSIGASILRAGATAQALAAEAGTLIIAPTAGSQARGRIAVIDTDFPEQILASYEKWKEHRIEQARRAWTAAKTRVTSPGKDGSVLPNGQGIAFGPDGKPQQNPDGSYNLLLAVISTGRVTDIDPKKVTHWSLPRLQEVDGKPTWIIDVTYPTNTLFGPMEVTSHAYVRDQQLLRWVFDSGEPVP